MVNFNDLLFPLWHQNFFGAIGRYILYYRTNRSTLKNEGAEVAEFAEPAAGKVEFA